MKKNILIILLFIVIVLVLFFNPQNKTESTYIPFNSERWKVGHTGGTLGSDIAPFREKMIYSLIRDYKINTLDKKQILNLLGPPDNENDSEHLLIYWLDWKPKNLGVDTLWQKELYIKFDKDDKTVTDFDVVQWWDTIY